MSALRHHSPSPILPGTSLGKAAAAVGVPAGATALLLFLTSAGVGSAGLAFLSFVAMMGTLLGGVLALVAVIRRRERSILLFVVVALAALVAIFIGVEIVFPHE